MNENSQHVPVLLKEVIEIFKPKPGKKFIDATLGFGGHTRGLIEKESQVLAIEWDPQVAKKTKKRLLSCCPDASLIIEVDNFANLKKIAKKNNFCPVDGILFDLGISRWHYKEAKRGFSFDDRQLDMRINPQTDQTAEEIINRYSLEELNELFAKLVQEKLAEPIGQAVVSARQVKPIRSAKRLANLIEQVYQEKGIKTDLHPATKVFLGLRIEVNKELENLKKGLNQGFEILNVNGKLAVITFHSGEDRIVKFFGKELKKSDRAETVLIFPSRKEIKKNRLARSAKLRVIKKLK